MTSVVVKRTALEVTITLSEDETKSLKDLFYNGVTIGTMSILGLDALSAKLSAAGFQGYSASWLSTAEKK